VSSSRKTYKQLFKTFNILCLLLEQLINNYYIYLHTKMKMNAINGMTTFHGTGKVIEFALLVEYKDMQDNELFPLLVWPEGQGLHTVFAFGWHWVIMTSPTPHLWHLIQLTLPWWWNVLSGHRQIVSASAAQLWICCWFRLHTVHRMHWLNLFK